jgi:pSer/pThr/pTyr-binding forkhead associated (FHA) protein
LTDCDDRYPFLTQKTYPSSQIFAKILTMRIEVLVPDENPVFYDLDKPRMVVGTDLECDIILSHSDVSRQHLIIIKDGDSYFVMDKGSTNGSYLNEERLIPGRKLEFNSFFPVRLGTDVLISLVSDEEGLAEEVEKIEIPIPKAYAQKAQPVRDEATRAISLKDLKEAKTEKLVKRRTEIKKVAAADPKNAKVKTKKKKKFQFTSAHFGAIAIMAVAFYFNNPFEKKIVEKTPEEIRLDEEGRIIEKNKRKVIAEKLKDSLPNFVPEFAKKMSDPKCEGDVAFLCENLKTQFTPPWGAIRSNENILVFINFAPFLEEARKILAPTVVEATPSKVTFSDEDIRRFAAALFMTNALKSVPDFTIYGKAKFIFGFYLPDDPKVLKMMTSVDPAKLGSLKFSIPYRRLMDIKDKGTKISEVISDSYDSHYFP